MVEVHANITARTRFIIPTIPSATVSRRCLVSRLDGGACDLTLIAAAPGSGKTALLAQWASVREDPVAWLSCNRDDADPSWFWRDVITAIRGAWTDVALGDTELTQDRESRHLAIEIANELEAHAQSGVIIIDDFHLAAPEPDAMVAFIDALPSSIRLVLGTRHDPLFPLGRMRVQGRLLELRQSDLRFDHDEMVEALDRLGVALAPKDLEQLESLTEGWAAGVHLAGLSLRGERVSEAMMRRLAATDRGLVDFLMNEVVDLQPAELLEFLMVGAELGEFDAELCDQVMGSSDGRVMIERVAAANLFLVGLDDEGTWFRFHHLFGEFLRARLRRTDPDRVGVIHRAAADSFGRRGDLLTAVRHSLSAGDTDGALDRLTTYMANSTTLADQSVGAAAAQAWLDEHGATTLDDSPERILSCVVALNGSNRHDAAEVWLRRVEANESHLDLAGRCTLEVVRSFHLLYAGNPERALHHAETALAIAEEHHLDGVWVPSIPLMTLQAHLWLDDPDSASAAVAAYDTFHAQIPVIASMRIPGFASQAAALRGDYLAAERLAEESRAAAQRLSVQPNAFGMAEPVTTFAELALEQNRLDDAEVWIEHLMRAVDNGRRPLLELKGHLLFASLASARGDDVVVGVQLERARSVFTDASAAILRHIDLTELHHAFRVGNLERCEMLVARLAPAVQTDLAQARVRLLANDPSTALQLLNPITDLPTPRLQIEHGILAALAIASTDTDAAQARLRVTLDLARTMNYRRTLLDAGPALWPLLRSLPVDAENSGYIDQLLSAESATIAPARVADQRELVEPLSERERTVLRYLSSRLDITEIAAALYLSVNTVRSHVKAIYRKLGVNSRAEAVSTGRTLGLT